MLVLVHCHLVSISDTMHKLLVTYATLHADSCKLKCNVDYSTIEQLAKGFKPAVELRSYFSSQ